MIEPAIPDLRTSTSAELSIADPDEPIGIRIRAFFERLGATRDPGLTAELDRLAATCDGATSPYNRPPADHQLARGQIALAVSSYQRHVCSLLGILAAPLPELHERARARVAAAAQAAGIKPMQLLGSMGAALPSMVAARALTGRGSNAVIEGYAEAVISHFPPAVIADVVAKTADQDVCYLLAMIVSPTTIYAGALPLARFEDLVGPRL